MTFLRSSPFEKAVSKAEGMIAERARLLDEIRRAAENLAALDSDVAAARQRVADEEFQAAQTEGGLAVASKAVLHGLAELELRAKSVRLRVQGLQAKVAGVNEQIRSAYAEIDALRREFVDRRSSDLSAQFDAAVDHFLGLLAQAFILAHATAFPRDKRHWLYMQAARLFLVNPLESVPYSRCVRNAVIWEFGPGLDGQVCDVGPKLPDGVRLQEELNRIGGQIGPIEAVMAEIGGRQATE